jgi:chloramphenicol-sensitive protein RarD
MSNSLKGFLFALLAFVSWGISPIYWKMLYEIPPFEILCYRIIWSFIFISLIITYQSRWREVYKVFKSFTNLKHLTLSSLLIGLNWFVFIYAVNTDRVLEASLGYYMNPIFNILIGYILLGEKLRLLHWISVVFVVLGVAYSLITYGKVPIMALTLGISFAFYGYARKKINIKPIPTLFLESMLLLLPSLIYIIYARWGQGSYFFKNNYLFLWIIFSGVITSLPLVWFASSTKYLKLSTIGIMQYIAPTLGFFLGVFLYKEPFDVNMLIMFIFIWIGVFIYTFESLRYNKN